MEVYNQHLEYIGIVDMYILYIIIPGDPNTSVLDSIVGLCEMTKIDWKHASVDRFFIPPVSERARINLQRDYHQE